MADKHGVKLEYDSKWKGPRSNRGCTDCFCLIIFLAFMGGWASIGYYAYTYGDLSLLLLPMDSEGRRCGHDTDVKDKKYLVFFDLTKCFGILAGINGCDTPEVCVSSCPTENFIWARNGKPPITNLIALRNTMICKTGIGVNTATLDELDMLVSNGSCASWYVKSSAIAGRCIPTVVPDEIIQQHAMTLTALKDATQHIQIVMQAEDFIKAVYHDIVYARWTILPILGISAIVCIFYILIMRWVATPVILLSIVGVIALLGYTTYCLYLLYAKTNLTFWLVLTIINGSLLGIILLVTICLRNRIRLACQLICEASKAVTSTTSTLFFPLIPWVLQVFVAAYALVLALWLSTLKVHSYSVRLGGTCTCSKESGYANGTTCLPAVFNASCSEGNEPCNSGGCYLNGTQSSWFNSYLHTYNVVGFFWLIFFVSAFGEMVLAGAFSTWYWTFKKSDVPFFTLTVSLWRTIRYHLGTLAFGSLIITICRLIRVALEWVNAKLNKYDNELVQCLLKCMRCCFWALEKFLKFINRNAYIMCAVHGKGFCASARSAFRLLMRNILRVFVLDKITDWLLFLGKVLVSGGVAWGTWWYTKYYLTGIQYPPVPAISVAIGTWFIACVFFNVYSTAVDTLFLCFLEDSERNDGTPSKPYYMSRNLMKILHK